MNAELQPPVMKNGILTVCAWCYPDRAVFTAFPHLDARDSQISHGICPRHLEVIRLDLQKDKKVA